MAAGLDFPLAGAELRISFPPVPAVRQHTEGVGPQMGGLTSFTRPPEIVVFEGRPELHGQEVIPTQVLLNISWTQLITDTTQGWGNRLNKPIAQDSDSKHINSKVPLWLNKRNMPVWIDDQMAKMDGGVKTTLDTRPTTSERSGALAAIDNRRKLEMCRTLCETGLTSDAVDSLDLLVQQGCRIPSNLFYLVLKRCIQLKDLGSGRRIHALTVKSNYEGDAFLATHLIGFYASHSRLEEAMGVFASVSTPDAYNWATIIFAYARHGGAAEAAEALQLYRKMCKSTVIKPEDRIHSAVLKACATARDLSTGRKVHAQILASSRKPDRFVQAGLVNMYAKCGSMEDARKLFDKLPDKDVVTWTGLIAGYAQKGMGQEAVDLYRSMQQEGLTRPNAVTYACVLQACACIGVGALEEGKQLHAEIETRKFQKDVILATALVHMYAKCGSLEDARRLFEELVERDVVTWTLLIAGYADQGMGQEALNLYRCMQQEGLSPPDSVTYVCLLQACANVGVGALDEGKQLHALIRQQGLQEDVVVGGSLVNMYAKCGSLEEARAVFDELPNRTVVTWTAMIAGYAQQGMGQEALCLYRSMKEDGLTPPNAVTYVCLMQACASLGVTALGKGKQLHAEIRKQGLEVDVVLAGSILNMYTKCGSLEDARLVFDQLSDRSVVVWTTMIAGYSQQGMGEDALTLYRNMRQEGLTPSSVAFACLLQACASVGVAALGEGKHLHADIREQGLQGDLVLGGSLVNMYSKCGSLDDARKLFDKLPERNIVAWGAMIAGYVQQGRGQEAFELYKSMQQEGLTPPNSVLYVCLLQACASVGAGALDQGMQLHAQIRGGGLLEDEVVSGSLVNMYAKCGSLDEARIVFEKLSSRDAVTWTAMIAGYVQQEMNREALDLYRRMQQEGQTSPDCVTYVWLLQACSAVAALPLGEQLHSKIEERGMQADSKVGAALVNMYAKCGSMHDSQRVFDSLSERTTEAWGALVGGYARQGDSGFVFHLLDRMRLEGTQPDEITLLSVLTVCSHAGLVDKGRMYFEAMTSDFGIPASMEHFICMVDLLGRAGHLGEALQMIRTMPFPPSDVVWHTLLGACRKWKNVEIGEQAFKGALSVDEENSAPYVLMSNIYASTQMWEEAKLMQATRMKLGVWKKPGQSWWTDMDGVVHTFVAGDKEHPEIDGIYERLDQLFPKMKKAGYVPHLQSSLRNISDDEKEAELCGHSEKLAIAYALNRTGDGATIRIVKNLRVCEDCHAAAAYISKLEKRTIICRDARRFHVYNKGRCSCGDYW